MQLHAQGRPRVAILGPDEEVRFSEMVDGLRRGLRDHGHAETTLQFLERRVQRDDRTAARIATEEIIAQGASVLFVIGSELAREVRRVSATIPIIFITPGDPVGAGLVASLARPGGNTTAMTFEFPELSAKRLELFKLIVPALRTVLVLHDPRDNSPRQSVAALREAAGKLSITLVERETRVREDLALGLSALDQVDGLLAVPGGVTTGGHAEMIGAARRAKRPAFFYSRASAKAGALASYGASDTNIAREAARLVDKILKGEPAGTLPVERPAKFELVVNLGVARDLGIALPPALLALADEVME